ncbi:MAG: 3-isopropylmalate dehydratase small subunit, partial [Spirochaetaceae bacterium]|jgi:3-isopropylmalate/(R)-2-methylmalate dehydratase small subunit|nr:3-isopropylmalate dehydratase small subunit [Spirochaetaceae bacterium]
MIAAEVSGAVLDGLFRDFAGVETFLSVDVDRGFFTFASGPAERSVGFTLRDFERALVEAGGWVEYAAARY